MNARMKLGFPNAMRRISHKSLNSYKYIVQSFSLCDFLHHHHSSIYTGRLRIGAQDLLSLVYRDEGKY